MLAPVVLKSPLPANERKECKHEGGGGGTLAKAWSLGLMGSSTAGEASRPTHTWLPEQVAPQSFSRKPSEVSGSVCFDSFEIENAPQVVRQSGSSALLNSIVHNMQVLYIGTVSVWYHPTVQSELDSLPFLGRNWRVLQLGAHLVQTAGGRWERTPPRRPRPPPRWRRPPAAPGSASAHASASVCAACSSEQIFQHISFATPLLHALVGPS